MKKLIKSLIVTIISFLSLYLSIDIDTNQLEENNYINVEIKGEIEKPGIYELKKGSNLKDLLDIAIILDSSDLSSYSLNTALYNNQIIVIPKISEEVLISINSADLKQLSSLPGIGIKTAEKIIEYRNNNGSFNSLEELMNVKGIGKSKFNKIKEYITL